MGLPNEEDPYGDSSAAEDENKYTESLSAAATGLASTVSESEKSGGHAGRHHMLEPKAELKPAGTPTAPSMDGHQPSTAVASAEMQQLQHAPGLFLPPPMTQFPPPGSHFQMAGYSSAAQPGHHQQEKGIIESSPMGHPQALAAWMGIAYGGGGGIYGRPMEAGRFIQFFETFLKSKYAIILIIFHFIDSR
jgi:hypothetical protein